MSKIRDLPELASLEQDDILYAVDESAGTNGGRKVKVSTVRTAVELTAEEVKTKYESNPDTNAFTDAEQSKLAGIESGATADQSAAEVPYDNSDSGLTATDIQAAIDEVVGRADADFRPTVLSGRILHYTGGTVRFDNVLYNLTASDILLTASITNGEVYVDLDGIVKQTGSGVLAPALTIVFAKFSTDLNDITSLTDERVKNSQNLVRGLLADVRDVRAGAAASEGTSGRLSDALHKHNILTAAAANQTPDQSSAEGSSTSLARADHVHNIPAGTPATSLTPATALTKGVDASFALSDHLHSVATALVGDISTIQPDDAAAAGTANTFARGDHKHAIVAAAAANQTPDQASAEGSSTSFARADHVHNIPTAAAVGLDTTSTNAQGAAATFARSNHTHAVASGAPSTQTPDQANAAGSSANFAKADHIHNIPAAAPTTVSTSSTNTKGVAATFALSDHVHNVTIANQEATATADDTTTSATDTLMVSMTATPAAGTYLVMWSGSIVNSANGAERTFVSLYLGGSQVAATERSIGTSGGAYSPAMTHAVISPNGSQAVELRWRVAGGTSTVHSRRLSLARVG